jgi:hypothetical protein
MLADDIAIAAAASRAPNKIFLVDTKTPFFLFFSYRAFTNRRNDTGAVAGNLGNSAHGKPGKRARPSGKRKGGRRAALSDRFLLFFDQNLNATPMLSTSTSDSPTSEPPTLL